MFEYINEWHLRLNSDHGIDVDVIFNDNGTATHVQLDGEEYSADSDSTRGIFVAVKKQFHSLQSLMKDAEEDMAAYRADIHSEADNQARHEKSMSDSSRYI